MPKRPGHRYNPPTYATKLAALRHGHIQYGKTKTGKTKEENSATGILLALGTDWEEIGENTWENKANFQYIRLIHDTWGSINHGWVIYVREGHNNNMVAHKQVKTKSQALKFAKSYMRKH